MRRYGRLGIFARTFSIRSRENEFIYGAHRAPAGKYRRISSSEESGWNTGTLGWFLAKSMVDTKGMGWAWFIHFLLDVVIFGAGAMIIAGQ